MADVIEKIGRFFAEQEAQIQETYSHVNYTQVRVKPSLSKPPPPVHRVPFNVNAPPSASPVPKPPRIKSALRRRQSLKSTVDPRQTQSWDDGINELLQDQGKASHPVCLSSHLVSWESLSPPVSSSHSSAKDEELASRSAEQLRKPRPPHQKHRKRSRRKKRSTNQEEERPDPKEVAKINAEKVAAALALAQERVKRLQQGKSQQEREQELERQEAAFHLQEQMRKIELVRARSFRSCSTMATARSSLSNCDTESVWTADMNDILGHQKEPSEFMVQLEAQLREKMLLEMGVKQSYIQKYKQRERVRLKLDKLRQHNAVHSSKVSRLAAQKASLEMELEALLDETSQTRQQRRELELADEKERLKRQREAERELQIRLREEEWSNMMEEEKARTQVAAEARAKASKRVEAHSAKLRRMMQYRYEPRQSSSTVVSSSRKSNNDEDGSGTSQGFKMDFFLPPELADFEEDGLCNNSEQSERATTFKWQVPSFSEDRFTEILLGIVSDEDE
ncbi:hypothetical protein DVH05_024753 [Phytophthora capsici]|nr:hypothetical protein DVH05_024753 [Phytophthora capsici]